MAIKSIKKFLISSILLQFFISSPPGLGENGGLKLDLLIEEVLHNHPEIIASKKRWEVYKERIPQARSLPDPMLSFGVTNLPTNFSFKDEDMTMKEISLSQTFPFYGKRRLMAEMAEREAEAVFNEIQEKTNRVVKEVKTTFFELTFVYQSIEIAKKNKEVLESFAKIAETQYGLGTGIQQDVLKAHIEVSKMVDELILLGQKRRALEARLGALLNRPMENPMGRPEEVPFMKLTLPLEELQKMALEENPVLKGMKKMIESKGKALEVARREYFPDLTLRVAYGQRDNGPEVKRRDMLTGMVEMNLPIFYKSKQERKVAEAKADLQGLEAQYRAMKNEILYLVAELASMVERIKRQIELYKTGILPQASHQVASALSAYRVGKADFMTLLDSRMTLYRYELEYHQAIAEYHKTISNLEAVVGRRFNP
ncbi:MAG: TolC family protein [Desulfobacterota bacterium]|nr:TolC family protein [Thermodesulfobacteriota bacterium]